MFLARRTFIVGLVLTAASENALAAKPTIFDFYEYQRKLRDASPTPHEHPWIPATVEGIDRARKEVTIYHVPAPSSGMPAMTMTFGIAEGVHLNMVKIGSSVDIQIDKHNGLIKIIDIRMRH